MKPDLKDRLAEHAQRSSQLVANAEVHMAEHGYQFSAVVNGVMVFRHRETGEVVRVNLSDGCDEQGEQRIPLAL